MLNLYQLIDIKSKIRKLTARPSVNQLSETELLKYINRYYQLQLPLEIRPLELRGWFEFDLTAGQDEYDLTSIVDFPAGTFDDLYISIEAPCMIDGYPLNLYIDPVEFLQTWPESVVFDDSEPDDVLFYDQKLVFRAPPDNIYHVKFAAWLRPAALVNDTDYPVNETWGTLIALGASLELLTDAAEIERAADIVQLKRVEIITRIMRRSSFQYVNQRSIPKW